MALTVTHAYVSSIPNSGDTTLVEPSDWNANHVLTGTLPSSQVDPFAIRVVGAGTITVNSSDQVIAVVNPTTAANPFVLPAIATRAGRQLSVYKWDANGGDMTFTPDGTETLMGLSLWTVVSSTGAGGGGSLSLIGSTQLTGWLVR